MEIEIPCFETAGVPSQYVESTGSMIGKSTRGLAFALKTLASTVSAHIYCGCENKDAGVYVDVRDSSSSYFPYTGVAASMVMCNNGQSVCSAVHGKAWVPDDSWTPESQKKAFELVVEDCFSECAESDSDSAIVAAFKSALDDYDYLTMEGSSLCCCKDLVDLEVCGEYIGIFNMQLGKDESERIFVLFNDVAWNWIDEKGRNNRCRAIKLVRCVFHWRCISHGRRYSNPAFVKAEGNAMLMQDGFHREWSLYADDLPTATLRTLSQMENDLYDKNREVVLLLDSVKTEGSTIEAIDQMYSAMVSLDSAGDQYTDEDGDQSADGATSASGTSKKKKRAGAKPRDKRAATLALFGLSTGLTQLSWGTSSNAESRGAGGVSTYVDLEAVKSPMPNIKSDDSTVELAASLFIRPGGLVPKKTVRLANIIFSKISRLLSDYHVYKKVSERKDAANPTLPKITKADDGRYSLRKRPLGVEFSPPLLVLGMGGDYYLESASRLLLAVNKGAATTGGYSGDVFFAASKITERPGHCTHVESTLKDPMMRMRTSGITSGSIGYLVHPIKPAVVDTDIQVAQVISTTEVAAAAQSIETTKLLERVARTQLDKDLPVARGNRGPGGDEASRVASDRLLQTIMEKRANESDIRLDWIVTRTARNFTQRSVEHISCIGDSRFYYTAMADSDVQSHPVNHFDSRYFPLFSMSMLNASQEEPGDLAGYSRFIVRVEAPGSSILPGALMKDFRDAVNTLLTTEDKGERRGCSCTLDEVKMLAALSGQQEAAFLKALTSFVGAGDISYMVRKLYLSAIVETGDGSKVISPLQMYIGVNIDGVWLLFGADSGIAGAICTMAFSDAAAVLTYNKRNKEPTTFAPLLDKRFDNHGLVAVAKTVCMSPFSPYRTPSEIRKKIATNAAYRDHTNIPNEWRFVDCKEKLPSEPQGSEFIVLRELSRETSALTNEGATHSNKVMHMYNFNAEVV